MKKIFLFSMIIVSFILQTPYSLAYTTEPPTLVSPKNNSKGVINRFTEFKWSGQSKYYNLQIALDTGFTQILFNADSLEDLNYIYQDELQLKTKYFWRVRAGTVADRSDWSSIFSMTITGLPDPPLLAIPLDKATDVQKEIVFSWSENPDAEYYHIQVATVENFNSNRAIDQANLKESGYETIYLQPQTKYYWHVRGTNKIGLGTWSPTWTFTTGNFTPSGVGQFKVYANNFFISPNPASNLINLEFNYAQNSKTILKIIDNTSREILSLNIDVIKGKNNYILDLKKMNICRGSYLLVLQGTQEQKLCKIVVE